jgi:hypothetical protein
MEILREFCTEEAPPGPQRLAAVRARVVAGFDAAPLSHARGRQRRRFGLPYPALTGGLAALAAAAAAAALIITPGGSGAGSASKQVRLDAAVVLHRAALAALTAPVPGTRQFIYAQVTSLQTGTGQSAPSPAPLGSNVLQRGEEWVSVTGTQPTTISATPCPGPPGMPTPAAVCTIRFQPGFYTFTYAGLEELPTAPGALLDYLYREQSGFCQGTDATVSRAELEWAAIYSIMTDVPVLPPRFGAALFTAAAQIPGVTVITNVTTAAGQPGIAVARTMPVNSQNPRASRLELIFSPHSYRSIGISATQLQAPASTSATAVTGTSFVATAPPATGPIVVGGHEGQCWTGLLPMPG